MPIISSTINKVGELYRQLQRASATLRPLAQGQKASALYSSADLTAAASTLHSLRLSLADVAHGMGARRWLYTGLPGRLKTVAAAATTGTTAQIAFELESEFDEIELYIPNASPNGIAGVKVSVAVSNAVNAASWYLDAAPSGGNTSWVDCTQNGGAIFLQGAGEASERATFTKLDKVVLPSLARTDGKRNAWLMVRLYYPAGVLMSVPYTDSYYWSGSTTSQPIPRIMKACTQAVDGIASKAAFTATSTVAVDFPVPIVGWKSRNPGVQVLISGDSTVEGLGGLSRYYGATQRACMALSTPDQPITYVNAGMHSQVSTRYSTELVADMLPLFKPDILVYSPWSVNDIGTGGATAPQVALMQANLDKVRSALTAVYPPPKLVLLEGLPCNTAFRDVGAGDQVRRDFNATYLPSVPEATVVTGYAAAITGVRTNGQDQIIAGFTSDNVHPLDAGYEPLSVPVRTTLASIINS